MDVTLNALEALAVLAAGAAAGAINAVVGSGTLVTFPVLLALGYPPVVANVSNTVGLAPGSFSGAYAYRKDLAGHSRLLWRLGFAAAAGGGTGAVLLLRLPPDAFRVIVPVLIALALVLVVAQPWLARKLATKQPSARGAAGPAEGTGPRSRRRDLLMLLGVFGTGVYGGYFGAAQGVLLLGLLGVLLSSDLRWVNGVKNVITGLVNGVAAVLFIALGTVAWQPALLIAVGSVVGGLIGGRWGRRLPPVALRAVIVVVGLVALVKLAL